MNHNISEIKNIRKKLDLTQADLAKKSGVSQSLIAKIESGKLDPAYSNAVKIFDSLNDLQDKTSLHASDFIHESVVSCKEDDLVSDVIKKMKTYEISQLPVIRGEQAVGVVSESKIIEKILDLNHKDLRVKQVMGEVPPMVSLNTPEAAISNLLRFFSMVLVHDGGKLKGVITRSDILRKVYG